MSSTERRIDSTIEYHLQLMFDELADVVYADSQNEDHDEEALLLVERAFARIDLSNAFEHHIY